MGEQASRHFGLVPGRPFCDVLSAFNSGYPGFLLPRGLSELGAVLGAVRTVPPENEAPVEVPVNTVPTGAGHPQVCEYPVPVSRACVLSEVEIYKYLGRRP